MLPVASEFQAKVRELGITDDDHIICYDTSGQYMASARAWWMFRVWRLEMKLTFRCLVTRRCLFCMVALFLLNFHLKSSNTDLLDLFLKSLYFWVLLM